MSHPRQPEWRDAYIARLVERGVSEAFAAATFDANAEGHDFDSDPIEAADDELSYWGDSAEMLAEDPRTGP